MIALLVRVGHVKKNYLSKRFNFLSKEESRIKVCSLTSKFIFNQSRSWRRVWIILSVALVLKAPREKVNKCKKTSIQYILGQNTIHSHKIQFPPENEHKVVFFNQYLLILLNFSNISASFKLWYEQRVNATIHYEIAGNWCGKRSLCDHSLTKFSNSLMISV